MPRPSSAVGRLIRADLIVIDDIGMLPVASDAAEALFRVVDAAYEKRSIALTSNIDPAGFDELMPKTLATATVDRLLHPAHVLLTDGTDSYRLAQATRHLNCPTALGATSKPAAFALLGGEHRPDHCASTP